MAACAVAVAVLGAAWWGWDALVVAEGGTPRLAIERTEIDLGHLRYNTPAEATFVLTNAGEGVLRISRLGRVTAVLGC